MAKNGTRERLEAGVQIGDFRIEQRLGAGGVESGDGLTVYRPSILVGDSRTGQTSQFGGFYQFVRMFSILKQEYGADDNGESTYIPLRIPGRPDDPQNFVPVDFAAGVWRRPSSALRIASSAWPSAFCSRTGFVLRGFSPSAADGGPACGAPFVESAGASCPGPSASAAPCWFSISIVATEPTASPGDTPIIATPCVARPWMEMPSTRVRRTMPSREITISSCEPFTMRAATPGPVLSSPLNVSTPLPPR